MMRRFTLALDTDASQNATVYSGPIAGLVHGIYLTLGTLASGAADITITDKETGLAILTITNAAASALYMPRAATHDIAGAALLYAAGGTAQADRIPVSGAIKVVVAQGGASKSGTLTIFVEGE